MLQILSVSKRAIIYAPKPSGVNYEKGGPECAAYLASKRVLIGFWRLLEAFGGLRILGPDEAGPSLNMGSRAGQGAIRFFNVLFFLTIRTRYSYTKTLSLTV